MLKMSYAHMEQNWKADCPARAISTLLDVPYDEASELLMAHTTYHPNSGVPTREFALLMESLGMEYVEARIRLTSKNAEARLPRKGILLFSEHVTTIKDGTLYDTFPTFSRAGCKQTTGYWIEGGQA